MGRKKASSERHSVYANILYGVVLIVCILAGYELIERILYELRGPFTADTPIYWAIGRGIVNGLIPYADLFETKPPGIYLLSALSLYITNSFFLTHAVQALVYIVVLGCCTAAGILIGKLDNTLYRYLYGGTGFLMGTALSFYVADRSGAVQIESFGACLGILCLLLFLLSQLQQKKYLIFCVGSSIALAVSIGFKEPFLFTTSAGAMFLCINRESYLKRYVVITMGSLVIGTVVLFLLGYLDEYIQIYLKAMYTRFSIGSTQTWERGGYLHPLLRSWQRFSAAFMLLVTLSSIYTFFTEDRSKKPYIKAIISIVLFCAATYLTFVSVGMGKAYYNHHYVFSVPAVYGLLVGSLLNIASWKQKHWKLVSLSSVCLCLIITNLHFINRNIQYEKRIRSHINKREKAVSMAINIDNMLDSCGENRYLFIGGNFAQPYAFTTHSPLGPRFLQLGPLHNTSYPYLLNGMRKSLKEANIVVFSKNRFRGPMKKEVQNYIDKNFTNKPWKCAKKFVTSNPQKDRYQYLFRKN